MQQHTGFSTTIVFKKPKSTNYDARENSGLSISKNKVILMTHIRIATLPSLVGFLSLASASSGAPPSNCLNAGFVVAEQKISQLNGGFTGSLDQGDKFGRSVASIGDIDGDGVTDLAIGAIRDNDGGSNTGAVWILFLNPNGTVKVHQKISDTEGNFNGLLNDNGEFGRGIGPLGDLDGNGTPDLAVGAIREDAERGAVWILLLNPNGTVSGSQKISDSEGGFSGILDPNDNFGRCEGLGDFDGDGVRDLAVGAPNDDDGGMDRGAIWLLFLNQNGTVKAHQKISQTSGGFTGQLADGDLFGSDIALLSDLDGDGVRDLAVGALGDDDGGINTGAVWVLFFNSDGTVKSHQKISNTEGGFAGPLENGDQIGREVSEVGDLDGNNVPDLAVGTIDDDGNSSQEGAVWIMFLNSDGTVKACRKITDGQSGFTGPLDFFDRIGWVDALGDLDGDGDPEIAIGTGEDDDGDVDAGAVYILSLDHCIHCAADQNADSFIGAADLAAMLGAWGFNPGSSADLTGDGLVGADDLAQLLGAWGPCP